MSTILSLAPQNVWKHFYSLTQVPRPSGHLKKIQEFLLWKEHRCRNISR